ncbi:zf-HC2 domain-containing protein [Gryllotalpicola sp.]|uniref:zf-HC2 domain-containing protein n=1 Tax=Gryllotalpicola sp. TaxID=1932787 RepID=UPI00260EEB33|nr:zf-HC2 domain-containing protein [Gryllotalpicola sp.]
MTDCGCDQAKRDLEEYLRNELAAQDAADIREHLAGCETCSTEERVNIVLTALVQRACKESAPEELRAMVELRIHEISTAG